MIDSQNIQDHLICDTWLSALLEGIATVSEADDRLVGALQLSSQQVRAGDVFVALPGLTADGRDYIPQAIECGASVVLYEASGFDVAPFQGASVPLIGIVGLKGILGTIASRYFGSPSKNMQVIGITGTNGKTTTAFLIAQALDLLEFPCAYSGTIGAGRIDSLYQTGLTTADAISTQKQMAGFQSMGAHAVAMEVSSHGLDQGRANGIDFDTAIFTNLSQDHLDYHGSMEAYGLAKRKLFEIETLKRVAINVDDPFGRELVDYCRQRHPKARLVTFGAADALVSPLVSPRQLLISDSGISFDLEHDGKTVRINSRLLGEINLSNLLAVIATLISMGYFLDAIAAVIPELVAPPGRMEVFRNAPEQPTVVVDYAHTPDALERALISLRQVCRGKLVVVFGCGGDRDRGKRPMMGKVAQALADEVIVTDDNPRTESPDDIVEEVLQGMASREKVNVEHDRAQALALAVSRCHGSDIVLLAGKGHEETQSVSGLQFDLNDREFVPRVLETLA